MKKFFALALLLFIGFTTFAQVDSVDVKLQYSPFILRYIGTKEGTDGVYMVRILEKKRNVITLYQDQVKSFNIDMEKLFMKVSEWEKKFKEYKKYNNIDTLYKQIPISLGKLSVFDKKGQKYEIEPEVYFMAVAGDVLDNYTVIFVFKQCDKIVRKINFTSESGGYNAYLFHEISSELDSYTITQELKKKLANIDEIFN